MKREVIDNLRKTITYHNHRYYVLGDPEIPDSLYDRMFLKLQNLEREFPEHHDKNSPTCRVGSDLFNDFKVLNHLTPMLSIQSVQTEHEISSFTTGFDSVCELKYDGAGINLIYKNGRLQKAITRGDGYKGTDVTTNIRTISNIPLTVNTQDEIEIRGEVWCPYSELKRLQKSDPNLKSPLAIAINSIKIKYSDKCAQRKLMFTAFHLTYGVAGSTHTESIHWLKDNHFNTPVTFYCFDPGKIQEMVRKFHSDIPADGVVFKHNNIDICQAEGNNYRTVNWAISYKFDKDIIEATVIGSGGRVGTGGIVKPFVYVIPVKIYNEVIGTIPVPYFVDIKEGAKVKIRRVGTRVGQIVNLPAPCSGPVDCPQCGAKLIHQGRNFFCPDNCQDPSYQFNKEYKHTFETNPDDFMITPGIYQAIANNESARLIPTAKTGKFKLYYDFPSQLADIGFAIGKYLNARNA